MPFREAFIALVPDADPQKDRAVLETGLYAFYAVLVPDVAAAVAVSRGLVIEDGVQSVNLCPGFANGDVAAVASAVGADIAVSVSRGDGRAAELTQRGLKAAGWL
jgi:hypothetical protein